MGPKVLIEAGKLILTVSTGRKPERNTIQCLCCGAEGWRSIYPNGLPDHSLITDDKPTLRHSKSCAVGAILTITGTWKS